MKVKSIQIRKTKYPEAPTAANRISKAVFLRSSSVIPEHMTIPTFMISNFRKCIKPLHITFLPPKT